MSILPPAAGAAARHSAGFVHHPAGDTHGLGRIARPAAALMAKARDLLAKAPQIEMVDVLAAKLPG